MKIHVICKRHYTNKDLLTDRFGRLYHLPVQLAALGAQVSVSAIDYRGRHSHTLEESGVRFQSEPAHPFKLLSVLPRLYSAARNARPDVIIASGDSHIGYLGLRIARQLSARFVFDVYDDYRVFAGNRIPGLKTMFRSAVRHADLVLCASSPLRNRLRTLNAASLIVPNGVNLDQFSPGDIRTAREAVGADPFATLIGYFGSITPTRGPILIDACSGLLRDNPSLRLILAGPVINVDVSPPWIDYRGALPQEAIPPLIRACDVVVIPYAEEPFNSMSGACKIAEYLACGRPVVATRVSNHEELFRDAPGSICEPNANSMAEALRRQLDTPEIARLPKGMTWKAIAQTLHRELLALGG